MLTNADLLQHGQDVAIVHTTNRGIRKSSKVKHDCAECVLDIALTSYAQHVGNGTVCTCIRMSHSKACTQFNT